jgi:hypothetical protein
MTDHSRLTPDPAAEWRSSLSGSVGALLLFTSLSGLLIYLMPFSAFNQFNVLTHSIVGIAMLLPIVWFVFRHWRRRHKGNLSHYQLLGYVALLVLIACVASGLVLGWQGLFATRINYTWDTAHLISGVGVLLFVLVHLGTVIARKATSMELRAAQQRYMVMSIIGTFVMFGGTGLWLGTYSADQRYQSFVEDYNWRFGEDRPFAPSMARLDYDNWTESTMDSVLAVLSPGVRAQFSQTLEQQDASVGLFSAVKQSVSIVAPSLTGRVDEVLGSATAWIKSDGAIEPAALAGSEGCGVSGCHTQIYEEWLPGAHRYSSMDDMFQRVQVLMAEETSPEHTRYCAGCHDPISLFSGAKNAGNITLSAHGSNEGTSCMVCHSIVQADVQGNGDYTIRLPERYLFESAEDGFEQMISQFLIRTYPAHHVETLARPLYKTEEFCAACHKQYLDKEVNTDIGKVQGQNQYDSWKNSRWYHEGDPEKTIGCRECHMPLLDSTDPASGDEQDYNRDADDNRHRSHRFLASNQYVPLLQNLEGAEEHVALTEQWLRGEIDIPEIADKWTEGPVVRLDIMSPETAIAGQPLSIRVVLTNNKTGHDFPTGPLDMIESWIEVEVVDSHGEVVYQTGAMDEDGTVTSSPVIYKSDGFDRQGELIDRHNLWDMVGASYKRSLYPGVTDAVQLSFRCPSMSRPRITDQDTSGERSREFDLPAGTDTSELTVTAKLNYRKANPEFLDRVYGIDEVIRSPVTVMSVATAKIEIVEDVSGSADPSSEQRPGAKLPE